MTSAVHTVDFTWHETHPAHPAQDVLVRLIGLDNAYDTRELGPYLLKQNGDGVWSGAIELPDDLRSSYQICPVRDFRIPESGLDDAGWEKVMAAGIPDPANDRAIGPCTYGNPGLASILELPRALPQPWCEHRPAVARGEVQTVETGLEWPSAAHVYTPPGYSPSQGPWPVAVLFDAQAWKAIDVTATFDNLIADGVVPPFIASFIGYQYGPTRVRGLTRPDIHLKYLLDELMPWLVNDFGATTDPAQTLLIGQSLGGLAAVHSALRAPERFGMILSQSGSFWWPGSSPPASAASDDSAASGTAASELSGAAVIAAFAARESPVPVRFWLEAGALEDGLVPGNRDLHATLTARGYDVTYREYQGGHDFACWRGGLADGLRSLFSPHAVARSTFALGG